MKLVGCKACGAVQGEQHSINAHARWDRVQGKRAAERAANAKGDALMVSELNALAREIMEMPLTKLALRRGVL